MRTFRLAGLVCAMAFVALFATGCPEKGPVQKAGEKIDKAADDISDAVNPKGPAEKAGRAIDRATDGE